MGACGRPWPTTPDYAPCHKCSDGLSRQEFQEIASIGQGNFSKVFRVKSKFDGMEYALKRSFRAVASELEAKRWQQVSTAGSLMRQP